MKQHQPHSLVPAHAFLLYMHYGFIYYPFCPHLKIASTLSFSMILSLKTYSLVICIFFVFSYFLWYCSWKTPCIFCTVGIHTFLSPQLPWAFALLNILVISSSHVCFKVVSYSTSFPLLTFWWSFWIYLYLLVSCTTF